MNEKILLVAESPVQIDPVLNDLIKALGVDVFCRERNKFVQSIGD